MFLVNLDPSIFEIFCEAKHLRKIGMDIPDSVYSLCLKEESLKQNQVGNELSIGMQLVAANISLIKRKKSDFVSRYFGPTSGTIFALEYRNPKERFLSFHC